MKAKLLIPSFLIGFFLAAALLNLTMCPEESTGPSDIDLPKSESIELRKFNEKAEDAFTNARIDTIMSMTHEDFAGIYAANAAAHPEKLAEFAKAFGKRKIIFGNAFYAEYELQLEGTKYTVAMGNSGDGNWKFIRF